MEAIGVRSTHFEFCAEEDGLLPGAANRFRVGDLDLIVLSDGDLYLDAGAVFGLVPRERWEPFAGPLDDHHRLTVGLNCVAFHARGKNVLIETGVGDKDGGMRGQSSPMEQGNLLDDLAREFVPDEEIDLVINTHLHSDHCGWNTRYVDGALRPTFSRAEYVADRVEWEAATHPNERTRATYLADNLTPVAESGRLRLVDGETNLTDEITLVPTPGHSEGHASVVITSGQETAIYVGDLVQNAVQLERTAWVSAFDVLPLMSMESKKRIVEKAIREKALMICVHLPFPGAGHMTSMPDGRKKWVPT